MALVSVIKMDEPSQKKVSRFLVVASRRVHKHCTSGEGEPVAAVKCDESHCDLVSEVHKPSPDSIPIYVLQESTMLRRKC